MNTDNQIPSNQSPESHQDSSTTNQNPDRPSSTNQDPDPTNQSPDKPDMRNQTGLDTFDTQKLSDNSKRKLLASHPYPPHLIQQWERERKFIKRSDNRNTRYPERIRKPSKKISSQTLLTEIKGENKIKPQKNKVSFNDKILQRETNTDEEGKYIFNRNLGKLGMFEFKEQWVSDPQPYPKHFEMRRGIKLWKDTSQREFYLLTVSET